MQAHADKLPPDWERISAEWRAKQLEYTWVRTLTGPGQHRDFWALTEEALDVVDRPTRDHRSSGTRRAARHVPQAARVPGRQTDPRRAARPRRPQRASYPTASRKCWPKLCAAAGIADLLDAVMSVEDAGVFKPDPRVYALAAGRLGLPLVEDGVRVQQRVGRAGGRAWRACRCSGATAPAAPSEYGLDRTATAIGGLAELAALLA